MDYYRLGDKIEYDGFNALVYLLRRFKRLTSDLKISKTISSDYGDYTITGGLTSVGGNFILEDDVTISSTNVLRNCFYTFSFTVIDVNLSGTVNKRIVKVTGDTGDNGVLEVVLEPSLLESDEVLLPEFSVDIVFDPHEYYTPVSVLDITLESDKRFVSNGEVATVTATVLDEDGEPLEDLTLQFNVNGVLYSRVTDENGQAFYEYTGTGVSSRIEVMVSGESLTIYDSFMTATVNKNKVTLGTSVLHPNWLISNGDVVIDWGDGTTSTVNNPTQPLTHNYTDGETEHTIVFIGEITGLGESCFYHIGVTSVFIPDTVTSLGNSCFSKCTGLTSITIPSSVTSIGNRCFQVCTGLTSITVPNSVTSIGEECFRGCRGLTSVVIPNSVTSMGNNCFQSCPIVDYQLYWKDTAIIEYNSDIMPVNSNTYFTIPQGQRTQYLSKHYPNKIKIREYDLSVTTDKTIITEDETSTVTATLTYNSEPVTDETVSYTIRQGATIIDTGTETTDSDGQIEIEYTGTNTGKITIQITYDTLTETTTIYDSTIHLQANNTDKTILQYNTYATVTTNNNRLQITTNTSATATYAGIDWYNNTITYHDIRLTDLTSNTYNLLLKDFQTNNKNIWRVGVYVKQDGGWQVLKTSPYLTNGDNLFEFTVPSDATALWVRVQTRNASKFYNCSMSDWVLYPVGGSGKISTSLSIGSDKASYYTDESILLTGSLTDEDDLPLVGADVKLYRGASLVDTVSTDSTGGFSKSVTGLSAGSYSFKAVYDGDDTYQGSTSSTVSVIVQNHAYSLSIASDKQSILTTESVTISGTLLKDSTAYASQSVDLYNGVTKIATLTTDSDGEYEETVSGLSVGVHTFKAVNDNAESSTISVTVSEPTHTYSLSIASDKSSILTTESVTLSGQLLMDSSPYASQSVALYDGSTLISTLTTDSDGEYEEILTGLSVGTHTFKAVNSNVESSTVSVTVTEPTPVHDYSLTLASTKDILSYADSESATVTATLTDNGSAVSGETLNYVIKHGSTTIDSGTDTTDANGEISFTYTATGIGDVDIEVSYSSLLQETYEVIDYISYDDATTDKASKYIIANLNSHTFSTDHYVAERTLSASASATYYSLVHETYNLPTDFEASVDLLVTNKSTSDHQFGLCISPDYPETYSGTNQCFLYSNRNRFAVGYRINGSLSNYGAYNSDFSTNTWYTFYIKVQGTTVTTTIKQGSNTIQSYTGTHSNIQSWKKLMLVIGGNSNNMYWKNIKVKAL